MKTALVIFATVFLAELGDKTQLATFLFAADPAVSKVTVFVAAAAALIASSLLAVLLGAAVGIWIPVRPLRVIAGAGFIGVGVWVLISALRT